MLFLPIRASNTSEINRFCALRHSNALEDDSPLLGCLPSRGRVRLFPENAGAPQWFFFLEIGPEWQGYIVGIETSRVLPVRREEKDRSSRW